MTRRPPVPGILLALLLLMAPFGAAQEAAPPETAQFLETGDLEVAHWTGTATEVNATFVQDEQSTLWFAVQPRADAAPPADANGTQDAQDNATANETDDAGAANDTASLVAVVELASEGLAFTDSVLTIPVPADADAWSFANTTITALPTQAGGLQYEFTITLREGGIDGPVVGDPFEGQGVVTVFEAPVPQPPADGLPDELLIGLLVLIVVGAGGGGAYVLKQRRERARIARAPRRSQALREAQLEQRLERAQAKERTDEAQQIQQEIRQQEKVRESRRELQILEAKRADALKTLELLRKRHEAGGLTKLQYESMVSKKQADLERIEREIAEMESEGGGPGAAA